MASLGNQSLPPTNLGRVDEEMASPIGRPLQCNQRNYARWNVKYYDNLLKVVETHSDLYEVSNGPLNHFLDNRLPWY
ncbi:hypothetical protein TNCV_2972211 [Trichonephila clavipes]|nr:hypothetical protein TNCV_2972211 [Trichonephila clavipes]